MTDTPDPSRPPPVILLVDDAPANLVILMETLSGRDYRLLVAKDGKSALETARKSPPDLVLLDIVMPGIDGYETCRRLKEDPTTAGAAVIFTSSLDETRDKVKGFDVGAVDYITKPFQPEEAIARVETHLTILGLRRRLERQNEELEHELRVAQELVSEAAVRMEGALLGDSSAVQKLRARVAEVAELDGPVLLQGPNGSGHEAVARAIHAQSGRRARAFLAVSCLGLGGDAVDLLFGKKRSFLGIGGEPGKWGLAAGGTLFLDQVESLPEAAQKALAKLLANADPARAPRLVAATGHALEDPRATPSLRADLRPSLTATTIAVPPLSKRKVDIPDLAEHFVRRRSAALGKPIEKVSRRSLKRLRDHSWPGSLDELQSVLECALAAADDPVLEVDPAFLEGRQRAGRYRLLELLGKGGMGEVWVAEHEVLRRKAAVKLVRTDAGAAGESGVLAQRFEREAMATAGLRSPNTVQLYDYGLTDDGAIYYVMELLSGVDLRTLVTEHGPLPPERAVWLLEQACRSLAEAHEAGLVHRDIKPANLFVCRLGPEYDFLKILDFGVVKSGTAEEDAELTGARVIGSPAYISPEAVLARGDVDGRADLYGLGCVAFWMLTGGRVFEYDTAEQALVFHCTSPPPRVSERSPHPVPPALEEIVTACLAKKPEDRPESATALWKSLRALDLPTRWDPLRAERWWVEHPAKPD